RELSVGEHTVNATGARNCCAPYTTKIKVVEGEDVQLVDIHLTLNPAHIFVGKAPEGASVTVTVRDKSGAVVGSGVGEALVPMKDTTLPVTIVLEANGQSKTFEDVLSPGDPRYEDFQ